MRRPCQQENYPVSPAGLRACFGSCVNWGCFHRRRKRLTRKALPADDSSWRKGSGGCEGGPQKVYGRPGALPVSTYRHWRVLQVPLPGGLLSAIYLLLRGLPEETGEVVCPQRRPCEMCPDGQHPICLTSLQKNFQDWQILLDRWGLTHYNKRCCYMFAVSKIRV